MPRRKKIVEEELPQEDQIVDLPAEDQIIDRTTEDQQPTEETIGTACSHGYGMEVPAIRSLTVDPKTLGLMLSGGFRPCRRYDQVIYQTDDRAHFSLFLAFRAVVPGGVIIVPPDVAELRMFNDCHREAVGELVRVFKK